MASMQVFLSVRRTRETCVSPWRIKVEENAVIQKQLLNEKRQREDKLMESSHCIWGYLKSLTQDLNSKLHSQVSLWITIRKSYSIINEQIQNLSELC